MYQLQMHIVTERADDGLISLMRGLLREISLSPESSAYFSRVGDFPSLTCSLYVDERLLEAQEGREFLSLVSYFRNNIESAGTKVLHIIIDKESPSPRLLRERNGLWVSPNAAQAGALWHALKESGAEELGEWLFVPFHPEAQNADADFEPCPPDERLQAFGRRINGSPRRVSPPVSLTIRLEEGYSLSDYVSTAFGDSLESFPNLGGENVMLTTLLQMNDKLTMINHYSEKLERPEPLNLYSLSAMNLSLVDVQDETNIAVLASSRKLIIEDIKLGE